jgi:putative colanic acid biosynthesis UDP-glucose lipid carrier transferase
MQTHRQKVNFFRVFSDIITLIGCFVAALVISHRNYKFNGYSEGYLLIGLLLTWAFFANSNKIYDEFRSRDFSFEIIAILKNIIAQSITAIVILFFLQETYFTRTFVISYTIMLAIFLTLERFTLRRLLNYLRKKGKNIRNVLIIGAGEVGVNFFKKIMQNKHFGYRLVGFLDDHQKPFLNGEYLGPIDNLDIILTQKQVDDVIVALPNYATEALDKVIKTCENHTTRVRIIPDYFRFSSGKFEITMFDQFPMISVRSEKLNELHWRLVKRAFDTGFTLLLFITVFWWLWGIIALAIKLTSKGPVFFKQDRWGRNNRYIKCYKFRSMVVESKDVNQKGEYLQATKDDPRITKVGKFLRKTNLDELPQFINVLKGEMSVVGPRPHPIPLNLIAKEQIEHYMLRTLVKPGITGWAQVNGFRGETDKLWKMQKRVDYDLWYIENWSFFLDIQIIFLTVWNMIKGDPNAY